MNNLKKFVKKSFFLTSLYEFFFQKPILNFFNSKFNKKVLLSYSTYHFKKFSYVAHSNYKESFVLAEIFHDLGYQVDIVNNNKKQKFNLASYDIVFGEGLPVFQALSLVPHPLTIYYGTGSHPFHCNEMSYERLISFYKKSNFMAFNSMRTSDNRWGLAASMSDSVICIGNAHTADTFRTRGCSNVYSVSPSFHVRSDALALGEIKDFSLCRKSLLWFGSYGLLHKGLDLAVEAVRNRPDWTLHVCGYTPAEADFLNKLVLPDNVTVHGFINVHSDDFKELALNCGFVILPSCSEGTATAIITAVGNGAMIPVVTKECGYDIDNVGFLIELNAADIERQLDNFDSLDTEMLQKMALAAQKIAITKYTIENYALQMKQHFNHILQNEVS